MTEQAQPTENRNQASDQGQSSAVDAVASQERKSTLERELQRYVRLLTSQDDAERRAGLERIIVFGSMASGEIGPWSDIDLVIVQRTDLPFIKRVRQVRQLLKPRVGTDILVYTPSEFEQLCQERPFVRQEIVEKGIVLYERPG